MNFKKFATLVVQASNEWEPAVSELIEDGNGVVVVMFFNGIDPERIKGVNKVQGIHIGHEGEYGERWEVKVTGVSRERYGFGTWCLALPGGEKIHDTTDILRWAKKNK